MYVNRTHGGVRGALRSILGGAVYSIMESAEIHSLDSSHKPHLNTYFSSVFPHLGWDFKFSVVFSSAQYLSMIYSTLTHPFCVLLRCGFCPHPAHAIVALHGINLLVRTNRNSSAVNRGQLDCFYAVGCPAK